MIFAAFLWCALLLHIISSAWLLLRGPRIARPLLLVLLAGILWAGGTLLLLDHALPTQSMLWAGRGILISMALCSGALLWFTARWPARMPWGQELALLWLVLMGISIVLSASPWGVTLGYTPGHHPVLQNGPITVLVIILMPLTVLIGALQLGSIGARLVGCQRLQARYLLSSYGIFFAGLCLDLLFPPRTFLPFMRCTPVMLAIAGTLAAYPLVFTRPFPLPRLLQRSLCSLVTIGVLGAGTAIMAPRIGMVLLRELYLPFYQTMLLVGMGTALIAHPLYRGIWWIYHRLFLCGYDDRHLLAELGTTLRTTVRIDTVVATVCTAIRRSVRPHPLAVLLARSDGTWQWGWDNPCEETLVQKGVDLQTYPPGLTALRHVVSTDELLHDSLQQTTGNWLRQAGFALVVPFMAGATCHGMLILGGKADREEYTPDDRAFLMLLANHTALALDNARQYEALYEMNSSLEVRVAERTQDLQDALAQLEEADRAKDRFLALLSHELLTPVTSIIGWTSLANDEENPPLTRNALTVIERNIRRQKRLVDDLLDASRIIHGKLGIDKAPLDLWETVVDVVQGQRPMAVEKGVAIVIDPLAPPLPVTGDPVRLQQAISNLLTNAIKFTLPGGSVTITQACVAGMVQVSVIDTGRGIAAETLPGIFELFRQGEKDENIGGLGIGLALIKGIVAVHDGTVSATSDGIGHGSTFTMTLPRRQTDVIDSSES